MPPLELRCGHTMCVAYGHLVICERWGRAVIPTLSCTRQSSFGGPGPVLAEQLWLRTLRTPVQTKSCASLPPIEWKSRKPLILAPEGRSKCQLPHTRNWTGGLLAPDLSPSRRDRRVPSLSRASRRHTCAAARELSRG